MLDDFLRLIMLPEDSSIFRTGSETTSIVFVTFEEALSDLLEIVNVIAKVPTINCSLVSIYSTIQTYSPGQYLEC